MSHEHSECGVSWSHQPSSRQCNSAAIAASRFLGSGENARLLIAVATTDGSQRQGYLGAGNAHKENDRHG